MHVRPGEDAPGTEVVGVRVTRERPEGVGLELRLTNGTTRRVWVPRTVIEDARLRLRPNQDLVAVVDGGGPLPESLAVGTLGLLCARPERAPMPLAEMGWWPGEGESLEHDLTEMPTELHVEADSRASRPRPVQIPDEEAEPTEVDRSSQRGWLPRWLR